MSIDIEKADNYAIVHVNSEKLDSLVAPLLKSELVILNSENFKNIIMDLSQTRYCDSSGLSAILIGNRLCTNLNGKLVLTSVHERVEKIVTISKLDTILNIAKTKEIATEMF